MRRVRPPSGNCHDVIRRSVTIEPFPVPVVKRPNMKACVPCRSSRLWLGTDRPTLLLVPACNSGQFPEEVPLDIDKTISRPAFGASSQPSTDQDDRPDAEPVAPISFRYWNCRFGMDPAAVGKTVEVNRLLLVVIGVTPQEFFGVS